MDNLSTSAETEKDPCCISQKDTISPTSARTNTRTVAVKGTWLADNNQNEKVLLQHQSSSEITLEISSLVEGEDGDGESIRSASSADDDDDLHPVTPKEFRDLIERCRIQQKRRAAQREIQYLMSDCLEAEEQLAEVRAELEEVDGLCQSVIAEELCGGEAPYSESFAKSLLEAAAASRKHKKALAGVTEATEEGRALKKALEKRDHLYNTAHRRNFKLLRKVRDNDSLVKVLDGVTPRSKPSSVSWASPSPCSDTKLIPDRDHKGVIWDVPVVGGGSDTHFVAHADYQALVEQAADEVDTVAFNEEELKKWKARLELTNKITEEELARLEERRGSLIALRKVAEAALDTPEKPARTPKRTLLRRHRSSTFLATASLKKALQEETKRQYQELKTQRNELLRDNYAMGDKLSRLEVKSKADLNRLQSQLSIHFEKFTLDDLRSSTG